MKKLQIIKDVIEIIDVQFGVEADSNYKFKDDVGLDSLDEVVIVMECEKLYKISVEDDDIRDMDNQTVEEFAEMLFVKYLKDK